MVITGSYWWLWLLITVFLIGYALLNQAKRTKELRNRALPRNTNDNSKTFFSGVVPLVFALLISCVSGALFVLSAMVKLVPPP